MSAGSSDRTIFGDWWLTVFCDKPAHLRFMLEVARYANRMGEVSVSALTIAQSMGTTERHAFAYRKAAISAGALTELRIDGRQKVYRVNYSNPANGGHVNDRHADERHANEPTATPANEQQRPLPTVVQENGNKNGSLNGIAAARDKNENDIAQEWARESPTDYPGVHDWPKFVAKRIRQGISPEHERSPNGGLRAGSDTCACCGKVENGRFVEPTFDVISGDSNERRFYCFGCLEMQPHTREYLAQLRCKTEPAALPR